MSMAEAMGKAAIIGLGAKLPAFNPNYCYVLQWQFEEDGIGPPKDKTFITAAGALNAMITIWNTPKTLVYISLSRRNA